MRRIAWLMLLLFAFAIPWEYSLELGAPLGNIARFIGVLLLLVAIPAVLGAGRMRSPGPMQWLVLALYLWFCATWLWTIDPVATFEKLRLMMKGMRWGRGWLRWNTTGARVRRLTAAANGRSR